MKRTIFCMLLTGTCASGFAQTTTQDTMPVIDRKAMDTMFSTNGDAPAMNRNTGSTPSATPMNQNGNWQNNSTNTNGQGTLSNGAWPRSTQNGSWNNSQTMGSTGAYNAYSNMYTDVTTVPPYLQSSFLQTYPMASDVTWQQSNDWYRARYMSNGRNMNVYYGPSGSSYSLALPVVQSYVPEEVVTKALSMHGHKLYAITGSKSLEGQEIYHVTLIDNGEARTEWISADGSTVANAFRTEDANAAYGTQQLSNGQQMNGTQQWNNGQQMNNGQNTNQQWNNQSTQPTQWNNNSMNSNTNGSTLNNTNPDGTYRSDVNATTGEWGTTNQGTMTETRKDKKMDKKHKKDKKKEMTTPEQY